MIHAMPGTIAATIILRILALTAAVLACGDAAARARGPTPPETVVKRSPLVVFVARGAADACGPGCSEWVAAEGAFDADAAQRFRDVITALGDRELPVFFNSPGGLIAPAMAVATILRERRMTVGVARTVPQGCAAAGMADAACRRLVHSQPQVTARLRLHDAGCHSACVYAVIGATTRQFDPGVRVGVHSARALSGAASAQAGDLHRALRLHVLTNGVDPALVDLAARVRFDRIHVLSRDEIARFGVETRDPHETPWMAHRETPEVLTLFKAITRPAGTGGPYLTSRLRLRCSADGAMDFAFMRDLRSEEIGVASTAEVVAGMSWLAPKVAQMQDKVLLGSKGDPGLIRNVLAVSEIVITETFAPPSTGGWIHVTRIATAGLAAALGDWRNRCIKPRERPPWNVGDLPGLLAPAYSTPPALDAAAEGDK
jgi:hypothetical protein